MQQRERLLLSESDVLRLMQDKSPQSRVEVATKIAGDVDNELTDQERTLANDILRLLARDVAVTVRKALSESLKSSENLPHDIALTMARDVEDVAMPILECSKILTETELVNLIKTGSEKKQSAIARREDVSEKISGAIVEHASEGAIADLMQNKNADLSDDKINRALNRFENSEQVHSALLGRENLPEGLAERLVGIISDHLLELVIKRSDFPDDVAVDILMRSRGNARQKLTEDDQATSHSLMNLITSLDAAENLTSSLLFRAICLGDLDFYEAALSYKSGLPLVNARLLIYDEGPLGLKTIFDSAKMELSLLPPSRVAINAAIDTVFDGEDGDYERRKRKVLERILTQVDGLDPEDLDYLLSKLESMTPIDFLGDVQKLSKKTS
jgi:uncharacterized protein (DUF2336 family)